MAAKGIVMNQDDLFIPINNRLDDDSDDGEFDDVSGIEGAIDALNVDGSTATIDEHPERRQKALYYAYYQSQLVIMKEEHPNLKLSQYKERIFEMWQKSPENPLYKERAKGNTVFMFRDK